MGILSRGIFKGEEIYYRILIIDIFSFEIGEK